MVDSRTNTKTKNIAHDNLPLYRILEEKTRHQRKCEQSKILFGQ